MTGYTRPSPIPGYGQAGQPVRPYEISEPAIPGLDQKNSYVRNLQGGTAWGDTPFLPGSPNGALVEGQTPGPWSDPRNDEHQNIGDFWRQKRMSDTTASAGYRIATAGLVQPGAPTVRERPILQQGEPTVDRWTAHTAAPAFNFQRPFNQWRARRFDGSHSTLGDATYSNQAIVVRGGSRQTFRTTSYERPSSLGNQTTTTEVSAPVNVLATGAGLRKWY